MSPRVITQRRIGIGIVCTIVLWYFSRFTIPLELSGQLVGVLFMLYGCLLASRHLIDGYQYPPHIPASAAAAGAGIALIVTEVTVIGVLSSMRITRIGYIGLAVGGTLAFYAYWVEFPEAHPELDASNS